MNLDKINLDQLISGAKGDYVDNTVNIRELQHSKLIHEDVKKMVFIIAEFMTAENQFNKKEYADDDVRIDTYLIKNEATGKYCVNKTKLNDACRESCSFLFTKYSMIYNMVLKQEINLNMLTQCLSVLGDIENGKIDQEAGSIKVGKMLYDMFCDSNSKHNEREITKNMEDDLDKLAQKEKTKNSVNKITWKEYKLNTPDKIKLH